MSHTDRLEENGVVTDCHIKTLEPDETLDFNFNSSNVINKIIMKVSDFFSLSVILASTYGPL